MSIGYITVGTNDLARARSFYDAVMPHIGGTLEQAYEGFAYCFAFANGTKMWLAKPHNKEAATPANGSMPGFVCATKEAVNAAHAAALANGGSNEGDPGPRPLYGPDFYGAYVRDPDGNKMSFVLG
jgi:catechol 2,3-dioxygenase-like lactoylglutathione lyase family enzyme